LDGDSKATVYLQNVTDESRHYTLEIDYEGGSYVLGVKDLPAKEATAYDIRKIRDEQIPDSLGHVIPLNVTGGKAFWSIHGSGDRAIIGRIEQANFVTGMSGTSSCGRCCPDSIADGFLLPGSVSGFPGDTTTFIAMQQDVDCFNNPRTPYQVSGFGFFSSDTSVATINSSTGFATGIAPGNTFISSDNVGDVYTSCGGETGNDEYCCDQEPLIVHCESSCEIKPPTVIITKSDGTALSSPFRLGISATTTSGTVHNRTQHLKATVNPANQVGNVTVGATSKISLSNVHSASGVITFDVVGATESSTSGDSSITATSQGMTLVTKPVSVVVPSKVATPHDTTGEYVKANRVTDATTSPSYNGLPSGKVALQTIYARFLTITVKDQFNALIGDIYEGAEITETLGASNVSINQTLTSSSTYSDPVGEGIVWGIVDAGSTTAKDWPTQSLQPMQSHMETESIPVQVDGFTLVPGINSRTWTATPPDTLTISWP